MTTTYEPTCPPVHRPELLLDPMTTVAGLRAAQGRLTAGIRSCEVWLYQDPPPALADPARWTVTAPPGARPVTVTAATIELLPTPHVRLELAGEPDVTRYRVEVDPDLAPPVAFDPLRTWLLARLRPECPDLGSCFAPPPDLAPDDGGPPFDLLARDYRSLRRALLEYRRQQDPEADLSVADPVVALVELFAHSGDLLHYRLDRVATEAYLETARLRTSVRRHARLVDFRVKDGTSARTFVHLSVTPLAADVAVQAGDVAADVAGSPLGFTVERSLVARAPLGEIAIYDWSEDACCLPAGATSCVLVRPQPADGLGNAWLQGQEHLVFEVVDPGDADTHVKWVHRDPAAPWPAGTALEPAFRPPLSSRPAQVVEVIAVEPFEDPLADPTMVLTRVSWRAEDALERSYPVGIDHARGAPEVAVARACVVPAHHGRAVDGPPGTTLRARANEGDRGDEPVSAWWMTGGGVLAAGGPGLSRDADGLPHQVDLTLELPSLVSAGADVITTLLNAQPGTFAAVIDTEVHEPPVLRFRTGAVGTAPPDGTEVRARYQVGSGSWGNVPANTLTVLERDGALLPHAVPDYELVGIDAGTGLNTLVARNPVPATGGNDPDPLDTVRRDAPEAFAAVPRRAVLPVDHATAARRLVFVRQASASRQWAGSWPLIEVAVDLDPAVQADPSTSAAALAGVGATLDQLRMLGTEVAVRPGRGVALLVAIEVCLRPGSDPSAARGRILTLLRPGRDDRPGLFHPSRLEMGSSLYLSAVQAVVAGLPEVDAVEVTEARRLSEPTGTVHEILGFGPDEVPLLDDDPDRPDRGRLDVTVRGGR